MNRVLQAVILTMFALLGFASPANSQATRTWVSGVGDDVNPCSRTAPCKTFAGAFNKTAAGGEINCLDPGGYGAVTITKAITISCPYTEGGALAGGNGVVVNAGANDVVYLRGLDIFGVNPPTNGIRFIAGAALHVEDTTIRRFNAANSQGISFQPSGNSLLFLTNVTIAENGNALTGGGILIQPTGVSGQARVVMDRVRLRNNANNALVISSSGNNGPGISVEIDNSEFSASPNGINVNQPLGTSPIAVMLTNSRVFGNTVNGIITSGGGALMRVGNTTITGNNIGINPTNGSVIESFGTNRLFGNPAFGAPNNGVFTGAIVTQN
jgi:hypothetical protein